MNDTEKLMILIVPFLLMVGIVLFWRLYTSNKINLPKGKLTWRFIVNGCPVLTIFPVETDESYLFSVAAKKAALAVFAARQAAKHYFSYSPLMMNIVDEALDDIVVKFIHSQFQFSEKHPDHISAILKSESGKNSRHIVYISDRIMKDSMDRMAHAVIYECMKVIEREAAHTSYHWDGSIWCTKNCKAICRLEAQTRYSELLKQEN